VLSDEPEDDLPPEEDEEEFEGSQDAENTVEAVSEEESEPRPSSAERSGERGGEGRGDGRKRRRRGGRGRNRERGPRPEGADTGEASPVAMSADFAEDPEGAAHPFTPEAPHQGSPHDGTSPDGQPLADGEQPRRKRRRRGRRGGRDRAPGSPEGQPSNAYVPAPEADRFGAAPDEIDTTPGAAPSFTHAPGAPSAPVWSLKDDVPDTTPQDDSKPAKKGWWQRTFSNE
jgi:ribonuclease E